MFRKLTSCLALVVFFTSCVSSRYKTEFQQSGESFTPRPLADKNVRVFFSSAPKGLSLNGELIAVENGFNHKILGQVKVLNDGVSPGVGAFIGLSIITLGAYAIYYVMAASNISHSREEVTEMLKTKAAEIGANAIVFANVTTTGAEAMFALGSGYAVTLDTELDYSKQISVSLSNPEIQLIYKSDQKFPALEGASKVAYLIEQPKGVTETIASMTHSGPAKESEKMINELKMATAELGANAFFVSKRKKWVNTVVCGNSGPPANVPIMCSIPYERLQVEAIQTK